VGLLATDTPEALAHLVERFPGSLLVADIDGQLAGTVIAGWDGWRGTIYRLAVVPRWRRRGVARTLVQRAIQYLREQGAQRVNLFVVADAAAAVAFWDSLQDLGFRRDPNKLRYVLTL
jgi:ribosomal protein S18 acetylase RimI-like enzyme